MKESILKTCTIEELIVELQSRAGVVSGLAPGENVMCLLIRQSQYGIDENPERNYGAIQ